MNFPLQVPIGIAADREYDYQWYKNHWKITIAKVFRWKMRGLARRLRIKSFFDGNCFTTIFIKHVPKVLK
jgi:hypothetical protein